MLISGIYKLKLPVGNYKVSHRNTVREDKGYKEGSIAQIGTHQKLSSIPGVYRQMWEAYTDAFQWELKTEYKA